jgi:nucleoside-diphosphate-sugar epimerase
MNRVNVEGTRNVMSAARTASVRRVIHFSSTDVYGHPGTNGIDESYTPTRFSNWYSRTKLEAESHVRDAAGDGDLEAVILRPATIYGPRSVNVVGEIAKAIRGGNMILIGGGRALAGLCYIDNLVDAALLALTEKAAAGETFNVTDGLAVTWRTFVDDMAGGLGCAQVRWSAPYWVASGLGFSMEQAYRLLRATTRVRTAPLLSRQAVDVMGRDQSFSNAKIRRVLGWEPRVDYQSGLRATLDWLSAQPTSS